MKHNIPNNIVIVGCGGVASYLVPALVRTLLAATGGLCELTLVDGDTLEDRNLDRQLFREDQIGLNKADALKALLTERQKITVIPEYFHEGVDLPEHACYIGCVDNHPARVALLSVADNNRSMVIICGNEETDADAYFYHPSWRDTPRDPRVRFPTLLTDHRDDPLRRGAGCTGEEAVMASGGQTPIANFVAAAFALHLFQSHFISGTELDPEFRGNLPLMHKSNFAQMSTDKVNTVPLEQAETAEVS
jgi:hypothetical protein